MKTWKEVSPYTGIEEDAPANQAGSGNIAGLGVAHPDRPGSGEPGMPVRKKKKKKEKLPLFGSKFIEKIKREMSYTHGYDTARPMADLSNINASKKSRKKK